jgi:hypothetical protein
LAAGQALPLSLGAGLARGHGLDTHRAGPTQQLGGSVANAQQSTCRVDSRFVPRLLTATAEQRAQFELSPRGIHWEALDEDVSIDGLLAGHGDLTHARLVTSA